MSAYGVSALFAALPHGLPGKKLNEFVELAFNDGGTGNACLVFLVVGGALFSLQRGLENVLSGHVRWAVIMVLVNIFVRFGFRWHMQVVSVWVDTGCDLVVDVCLLCCGRLHVAAFL